MGGPHSAFKSLLERFTGFLRCVVIADVCSYSNQGQTNVQDNEAASAQL